MEGRKKSKSKTRKRSLNKDLPVDKENQNGLINLVIDNSNEFKVKQALEQLIKDKGGIPDALDAFSFYQGLGSSDEDLYNLLIKTTEKLKYVSQTLKHQEVDTGELVEHSIKLAKIDLRIE